MYRVADIMTKELVTLKETDDVALADAILALGRFRHLPVVGEDGRLVGLISQRDLLQLWAERGRGGLSRVLVREVMTREPNVAHPDMPVFEAASWMLQSRFGCLPVVEKGRLVGLVTESDFLRLAARLAETAPGPLGDVPVDRPQH